MTTSLQSGKVQNCHMHTVVTARCLSMSASRALIRRAHAHGAGTLPGATAGVESQVQSLVHKVDQTRAHMIQAAFQHLKRREQHWVKMAHLERKAAQLVLSRQNSASNLELNGHTMRFSQNHDHVEPATEEAEAKYLEAAIRASLSQVPTAPVIVCQTDRNRLHFCTKDLAPTSRGQGHPFCG